VSVISDLAKDTRYHDKACTSSWPHNRFYAGVPLRTSRGIYVGAYCIFDDKPREGLTVSQVEFMQSMSLAVMSHLELRRNAESSGRSERMVRGIGSFVEGKAPMSNLWRGTNAAAFEQSGTEGKLDRNQQLLQQADTERGMDVNKSPIEIPRTLSNNVTILPNRSQASASPTGRERERDESSSSTPLN
jgi:hypothetical protein